MKFSFFLWYVLVASVELWRKSQTYQVIIILWYYSSLFIQCESDWAVVWEWSQWTYSDVLSSVEMIVCHVFLSWCEIILLLLLLLSCLWSSAVWWIFKSWISDSSSCLLFILLLFKQSWRLQKSILSINNLEQDKWLYRLETLSLA